MSIDVRQSVTIGRPALELYQRWRDLERLPELMRHLKSVTVLDDQRSHWVAKGPADSSIEWDARIVLDRPGELLAWRSEEGAEVPNEGKVEFSAAPAGQGTEVRVHLHYDPPLGVVGKTFARLFGEEPSQQVREDLKRFQQHVEAGEIATTEGKPKGPRLPTRGDRSPKQGEDDETEPAPDAELPPLEEEAPEIELPSGSQRGQEDGR